MNWKPPVYWTLAVIVAGLMLLVVGSVDQLILQLANNTTGVTP